MIDDVSDFIDRNLRAIRTGLGLTVGLAGAYLVLRSRHSVKISHLSVLKHGTRLGGQFLLKGTQVYFEHVPLLHRVLFFTPRTPASASVDEKHLAEKCIPVEWAGVSLSSDAAKDTAAAALLRARVHGRMGKLVVFGHSTKDTPLNGQKQAVSVYGQILVKMHSYSPLLADPAISLLRNKVLQHCPDPRLPPSLDARYRQKSTAWWRRWMS
ncbi:MAG: hypothetical protein SGCHY_000301 [Lobulomycetales sp.]